MPHWKDCSSHGTSVPSKLCVRTQVLETVHTHKFTAHRHIVAQTYFCAVFIAVGGGGDVAPPFGSIRQKFGQIVYYLGTPVAKNCLIFSEDLFFLENTLIWTEKPSQFESRPFFLENILI